MNFLYVFNLSENDVGPKKHVSEVMKNTRHSIKYISNLKIELFNNFLVIIEPKSNLGVFFNIQLFQLLCFWYIFKHRKSIDLIIIRQSIGFFLLSFLLKVFNIKVITEVNGLVQQDVIDRGRDGFSRLLIRVLERLNLLCNDAIVVVHDNIKQSLVGFYGEGIGKKIVVVENGVDIEPFSSPPTVSCKKLIIGYLGSFAHREGVDFLPKVSLELTRRGIKHEFHMVGGSPDEVASFRPMLSDEVVNSFRLYGYVDYLKAKEILKSCHLFIHLRRPIKGVTDSQGCPLKILDYLSVGRCVLATSIQSYKFLEENNLGVLVPYSVVSFERNIAERIAAMNDVSLERFYNKGQDYLVNKTWKNQVGLLDDLCESVIRRG